MRLGRSPLVSCRLALGAVVVLGTGCASGADDPKAEEANFAVLPVSTLTSILPAIEEAEGEPEVCIGLLGYANDAERQAAFEKLTSQITTTANAWNDLLAGNPLWRLKARVKPFYFQQTTQCTEVNFAGFSVNLWKTADQFKQEFCFDRPESQCASAARSRARMFFLGPWNRDHEEDPLDGFTVLHEYGHLLGLGDTYKTPGVNDFVGEQPPSIMNGKSFFLTDDDKLGLWATLRAVKTGFRSCEGFAESASFTANGFNAILCNPQAQPTNGHDGRPEEGEVPQAPTGPIPESSLREVAEFQAASLQLNCRAGAGTEHAVVTRLVKGDPLPASSGSFFQPKIAHSTEGRPWVLVNANGKSCYVSGNYQFIRPVGVIPMTTLREVNGYAVSTERLNCRSGAGTEHAVVRELPLGTKLSAEPGTGSRPRIAFSAEGNPWILVRTGAQTCYASANFRFIFAQQ
jgi:uncharacterized protein YraI